MIHIFIGTKAQLIKTAPVLRALDARSVPYRWIDSGQHGDFTRRQRDALGIPPPDVRLSEALSDVDTLRKGAAWSGGLLLKWAFRPAWIRSEVFGNLGGVCLVHGDTFSTLLGALFAKRAGLSLGHIESGLRSFQYFNPFPEELIRIACMRMSDICYAPDAQAMENLTALKVPGRVVSSSGNTVIDALRYELDTGGADGENDGRDIGESPYILAACHRMETIRSKRALGKIVECLNAAAEHHRVDFILHPPTARALERFELLDALSSRVITRPLVEHQEFVQAMRGAVCVMADGGSIQEECAALGVPLMILRSRSERSDGIGTNAAFADFQATNVRQFIESLDSLTGRVQSSNALSDQSPSEQIVDDLVAHGFSTG